MKNLIRKFYKTVAMILCVSVVVPTFLGGHVVAATETIDIDGKFYEWGKDSKYPFSDSSGSNTNNADTYGDFSISGNLSETDDHNGVQSFLVASEQNVSFKYAYDDSMISDNDSGDVHWHITDDPHKKINDDNINLKEKIKSGAIVIQTSLDGSHWVNDEIYTDVFEATPVQNSSIFTTNDIQLLNGTYYRFIVVYRERRMTGSSGWGVFQSLKYEYRERAEVYEFYLESETSYNYEDNDSRQQLGSVVNAGSHNGFSSEDPITSRDDHYGWTLGNFFVSGYSDKVTDSDGFIFLKNVGDRVALNFELLQNINHLNDTDYLKINRDRDGSDDYFQTDTDIDFERGALIIRFRDYQGVYHEPQIYTNFLEANTRTGADTRVYLFEEGDYEVALDYEIRNTRGLDSYHNYRIFFTFKIRNGNCMVFPFDSSTHSELDNLSSTPNGFTLDLARSRYLHITVTKYVMNTNGNALDQRFCRNAADGTAYTEEGIYVITVTNDYAPGTSYRKIICVGTNSLLNNYYRLHVVPDPSIIGG